MAMRDLIPWGRQESRPPIRYREEEPSPLMSLRREMDRLFDDFFTAPFGGGRATIWPNVEVGERDDEIRVTAEVPGMKEEDVELLLESGTLTIRGEKKAEQEESGWSERFYGRFERRIALPDGADEAKCEANFRDGVLTVRMPKSESAARARTIPINAGTRH